MGQGPLVLKAAQALGPVQTLGKRQITSQSWSENRREGRKNYLCFTDRETEAWNIHVAVCHQGPPLPSGTGTARSHHLLKGCKGNRPGHDTHGSSWPAQIPAIREGDLIPAPDARQRDLHSHGDQRLAKATGHWGQRARTLVTSKQGDTPVLAQADTPKQEPKCGVRPFYPFLQP